METTVTVAPFAVMGIWVSTTNRDGKAMTDIGSLWQRFYLEYIEAKIPGRVGNEIYGIYTDYKSDHTDEYTALIGCKVSSIAKVPPGLSAVMISGGTYAKFVAKGKMPDAVVNEWAAIWKLGEQLQRSYTSDFEVYDTRSHAPNNAEVDIFVAIR